jgi:hypothetical protein
MAGDFRLPIYREAQLPFKTAFSINLSALD